MGLKKRGLSRVHLLSYFELKLSQVKMYVRDIKGAGIETNVLSSEPPLVARSLLVSFTKLARFA